jgi:two-component system chemotaxis response regulator CheB
MAIRVLIVDDSLVMRAILSELLQQEGDIEVVGTSANAVEARADIKRLNPDVVTLDIEMPGMNGLNFLEMVMRLRPMPVVIVSGAIQTGINFAEEAKAIGAAEFYAKPDGRAGSMLQADGGELARRVRAAAAKSHLYPDPAAQRVTASGQVVNPSDGVRGRKADIIAIGSSTGGVEALQTLLTEFPEDCPPTVIVQHIHANFIGSVARRLDGMCRARVQLAQPDLPLRQGHVYFAPSNEHHLRVSGGNGFVAKLRTGDPISGHRPSVDALFHSVAEVAGPRAVGILLSGMGSDGANGLLAMHRAGAYTIAQDEASCPVFGMPRAAIALGAASQVLPLTQIASRVLAKAAA